MLEGSVTVVRVNQDRICCVCRYYLNGADAYRLKLLLPMTEAMMKRQLAHDEDQVQQPQANGEQHQGEHATMHHNVQHQHIDGQQPAAAAHKP